MSGARTHAARASAGTQTHTHDDYTRHGTVTLFAALVQLTGELIARTEASHTHVEWLRFLKQIDRDTPPDLELHLIADNYATHKHPKVRAWLKKHPRFKMHFTPTSSSWLNLVERFFADLTGDVIRAGSFTSVNELVRDIKAYLAERNANPKPYKWKAAGAKSTTPAPTSTKPRPHEVFDGTLVQWRGDSSVAHDKDLNVKTASDQMPAKRIKNWTSGAAVCIDRDEGPVFNLPRLWL
jgi:DDE superfamily endonuclease